MRIHACPARVSRGAPRRVAAAPRRPTWPRYRRKSQEDSRGLDPAIYLDRSHAQPSVNTSKERKKKREREESEDLRFARVNTC